MGDVTTTYFHDGAKIIDELRGKTRIQYLYDAEEVIGFKAQSFYYYFVKDTQSNVRAILQVKLVGINSFELKEVARYDYDAWGNAMVTAVGDEKIDGISVAEFNPIRWKSQYYDTESGLYYINGRYYSPMTKQYLSGANVESTMLNATTIYSLCLYSFALTNPVNMGYNGYTSETNRPLVYDPPELNAWEKFWQSTLGKIIAGVLALAAIVLSAVVGQVETVLATTGLTVGSLTIFAAIAGYQSSLRGKGFWRGFEQYICGKWAQEVAITALLVIVSIGISAIAAGTAKSGSTQAPANVSQETTNPVIEAAKRGDYDEIARLSTHNAESNKVMLGKYDGGGATSYIAKAGKEYTYFSLNEWDDVARIVGSQNMWKINQAFLDQQIALGKTFYTSHSIVGASGAFYEEIVYLQSLGISL